MKKLNSLIFAGISASVVLLACASANAQVTVTVDENGNVTSSSPVGPFINNPGTVTANPYALSTTALVYDFSSTYPQSSLAPVAGFVNIYADAAHTQLIDVIGFEPDGPSYLIDMDLVNDGSKADVPSIPAAILADEASGVFAVTNVTEGMCGVTTYSPNNDNGPTEQPGHLDDAGGPITYTFLTITGYCAPDGGTTVTLLGIGLIGLGTLKRKLGRN